MRDQAQAPQASMFHPPTTNTGVSHQHKPAVQPATFNSQPHSWSKRGPRSSIFQGLRSPSGRDHVSPERGSRVARLHLEIPDDLLRSWLPGRKISIRGGFLKWVTRRLASFRFHADVGVESQK